MSYLGDGPESWVIPPNAEGIAAYNALLAADTQEHVFERAFADRSRNAIANYEFVDAALSAAPPLATPFPATSLGQQLRMAARLIQVRAALGMSRQVFYVSAGAYDTHNNQVDDQQWNLSQLSQALKAFHEATVELAIDQSVTSFTASDFGRSLGVNVDGTDHGWGGHHFVVGGAVRGQRFYGAMPSLRDTANPDDTGFGQIIPTGRRSVCRDAGQMVWRQQQRNCRHLPVAGALCHRRSGISRLIGSGQRCRPATGKCALPGACRAELARPQSRKRSKLRSTRAAVR